MQTGSHSTILMLGMKPVMKWEYKNNQNAILEKKCTLKLANSWGTLRASVPQQLCLLDSILG